MKKIFLGLGVCAALTFGAITATHLAPIQVLAEEEPPIVEPETPETPEEPIELPCKVKIGEDIVGGKLKFDISEGNVGDIVTITVDADAFYLLESITVNGISLVPNDDGTYTFALVEGENIVVPVFIVNENLLKQFSGIYAQIKAGNWSEVFSVQNIIIFINAILNGGIGIALVRVFSKYKYRKALGKDYVENKVKDINDKLAEIVPNAVANVVTDFMNSIITPLFEKMDNIEESNKTFAKCLALAQENTPESRLAIIETLSSVKISDKDVMNEVKDFVQKEVDSIKECYEKQINALKEAQESNEKILKEDNETKKEIRPEE